MDIMNSNSISRRNFIGKTTAMTGLSVCGANSLFGNSSVPNGFRDRLPREVWIATVSQMGLSADTPEAMVEMICNILKKAIPYQPDIICLPEVFITTNIRQRLTLKEKVDVESRLSEKIAAFSKTNNCYSVCPMYTHENGIIYNSAVLFDRQGKRIGEYRKIHLPEDEMKQGMTPGPLHPPVFKTDFGIVGIQICFDMLWNDAWKALRQQGAEIVFWPSAYAGGKTVNTKAWQNKYVVVSSSQKNTSKICDISGDVVAQTGIWDNNLICAPVNLEKVFLNTWPFVQRFDEIRAKYGRKIKIVNYHEEEWSTIESLSPDVRVNDILKEFDLKTHEQLTHDSEITHNEIRNKR